MLQQSLEVDADTFASMLSNLTRSRQQAAQAKAVGEHSLPGLACQSQACCARRGSQTGAGQCDINMLLLVRQIGSSTYGLSNGAMCH